MKKRRRILDELIGENEKIRPVVQSGNEMLDVILNSKLSAAADAGIVVELARMQAPNKLPLTDAELCSLMMNLLDNALEAASAPGVKRRYIKLDMHIQNKLFRVHLRKRGHTGLDQQRNRAGARFGIENHPTDRGTVWKPVRYGVRR